MSLWWDRIEQWFEEEDRAIEAKFDSITLYTGDEGVGKSYTMLARHWVSSRGRFNIDRVHFEQEDFMQDCTTLEPGDAVQLDEFDGHRRMAMHGKRMDFLKFLKERRSLRLRMGIGFPHVDQLERDILNSRIRYWVDIPERGLLHVHRRRSKTVNRAGEAPFKVVDFPMVGRFRIPEPEGPLVKQYDGKKADFTRRDVPSKEPALQARRFNEEAARPVLERILATVATPAVPVAVNQVFLDDVMDDIKRAQ